MREMIRESTLGSTPRVPDESSPLLIPSFSYQRDVALPDAPVGGVANLRGYAGGQPPLLSPRLPARSAVTHHRAVVTATGELLRGGST